jgi:hypothetical protein
MYLDELPFLPRHTNVRSTRSCKRPCIDMVDMDENGASKIAFELTGIGCLLAPHEETLWRHPAPLLGLPAGPESRQAFCILALVRSFKNSIFL